MWFGGWGFGVCIRVISFKFEISKMMYYIVVIWKIIVLEFVKKMKVYLEKWKKCLIVFVFWKNG